MSIQRPSGIADFVHPLLRARDWQDRPQLGEVCRWWLEGGKGVWALIGIGGAGKTAIADRFLQVLPGVFPPHPDAPKRNDLTQPARLFVFSFYDAPNPDSFFTARFNTKRRSPSYQQTLQALQRAGSCLIVLDGLEKVQDDGVRSGIFGELQDGRLIDLLVRVFAQSDYRHERRRRKRLRRNRKQHRAATLQGPQHRATSDE